MPAAIGVVVLGVLIVFLISTGLDRLCAIEAHVEMPTHHTCFLEEPR